MREFAAPDSSDAVRSNHPPKLEVRVARSFDDMMMVVAVRALVYCGEQACPYAEEFDGNDFSATHLIGFVDGEPAATIRLRYFGKFAKHERTTVRKEYRGSGISRAIIEYSLDYLRRKGFDTVYGHAAVGLKDYWSTIGWQACGDSFSFSDHEFLPMTRRLEADADAFEVTTDPLVLNRPEGDWDRPGILDQSVSR